MTLTRRTFLAGVSATAALPAAAWLRLRGVNEDLRIGVIGLNGRGRDLLAGFRRLAGVRVVALCDVDRKVLDREVRAFSDRQETVAAATDARRLFDNPGIDAVAIATPNHWHSLLAIWACQAGKDVYVEKPVSHNVWEGRKLVEAAAKHARVVQTGTQSRSSPGLRELMAAIHGGALGRITLVRGLCYKIRKSIGKVDGEQPVPESVDYDLWCGPAPKRPLRRRNLHYDWHWVWPTGNGDLGNQGVHQMDIARWALGVGAIAPRVLSFGGRLGYVDDGETPNTLVVVHDYPQAPLVFEVRGLSRTPGEDTMDDYRGARVGVVIDGEKGSVVIDTYEHATVFDEKGATVREVSGPGDHVLDFVEAVRRRRPEAVTAPPLDGHLSAALCHTGNISYRLGAAAPPGEVRERLRANPAAMECLGRLEPHFVAHGIDLAKTPLTLGIPLTLDPASEHCVNNDAGNALLSRDYRPPFVVPARL